MLALIILCLVVYLSAYYCLKVSGHSIDVTLIQSFEDYFIDNNENKL